MSLIVKHILHERPIFYHETITLEVFCDDPVMLYKYLDLSRTLVLELWNG
jgi:hypothetical protein